MTIPAVPATSTIDRELKVGHVSFDGVTPRLLGELTDYAAFTKELSSKNDERTPVLVIDVKGLQRKTINDVLLKNFKIRGMQIWLMTYIESVDDIFDAFNTDADFVLMPYHAIRSDSELHDILSISDASIPALFVRDGMVVGKKGKEELTATVDKLAGIGYTTVMVFDMTGNLKKENWSAISSRARILPYVGDRKDIAASLKDMGFENVFIYAL